MRLRLTDGRIVPADSLHDCGCITHSGPHWLHMDQMWKQANAELKARGTTLALMGFIQEEQARLAEKLQQMTVNGVAEVLPDEPAG